MSKPGVLDIVSDALKKNTGEILKEMLETSEKGSRVKNWKWLAALEAYARMPVGFGPSKTLAEIHKENEIANNVCVKKGDILHELKKQGIFVDWSDANGKSFTAVTVIDHNHHRLLETWDIHYALKSVDEALTYTECFRKLYQELMVLAKDKKNAHFSATKMKISITIQKAETIEVCGTDIEDD